jgi:hypothetical protein
MSALSEDCSLEDLPVASLGLQFKFSHHPRLSLRDSAVHPGNASL